VTNILLSFLTTARADSKRFEMLSLLSTILSWDDEEREKAGLQRAPKGKGRRKSAVKETAEDDAMSEVSGRATRGRGCRARGWRQAGGAAERGQQRSGRSRDQSSHQSFSNLFVEFLLKEASQGRDGEASPSPKPGPRSPGPYSPSPGTLTLSPPASGAATPLTRGYSHNRTRALSTTSNTSREGSSASLDAMVAAGRDKPGRKQSFGLSEVLRQG
jgi:hypothetical protein